MKEQRDLYHVAAPLSEGEWMRVGKDPIVDNLDRFIVEQKGVRRQFQAAYQRLIVHTPPSLEGLLEL